jgi:alpha-glucosidase
MNHVGEKPADPLTLLLYSAEGVGDTTLYEDAGNGFGYERGEYARRRVVCEASADGISVRLGEREGSFVPERSSVNLEFRGVSTRPQIVSMNGEEKADWSYEEDGGKLVVSLVEDVSEVAVKTRL